jgi:hypothetical protein
MGNKAALRTTLSMLQSSKLLIFIEDKYVASGVSDELFAKKATEELGFPVIRRHVTSRREVLNIPSNKELQARADESVLVRLKKVEDWLTINFPDWWKGL